VSAGRACGLTRAQGVIGPAPPREKAVPPPPTFASEPKPSADGSAPTTKTQRSLPSLQARANFHTIEGDDLKAYLDRLPAKEESRSARDAAAAAAAPAPAEGQADAPAAGDAMQTD
jgi:hypothetical protein